MTDNTTTAAPRQTAFNRALAEYLLARDTLDALPDDTTTHEAETLAMDALCAAERRLFKQTPQNIADVRALAEVAFADPDSLPGWELIGAVLNGLRQFDPEPSRVFNPTKWVDAYRRFGGGWVVTDEGVQLLMPVPASDTLENLMWELRTRGGEDAVKAVIEAGEHIASPAVETTDRLTWENIKRRYEAEDERMAENEATPYTGTIDDPECAKAEAKTAEIVDAYDAAAEALLRFPAPDAEALAFKLKVMAGDFFAMFHSRHGSELAKIIAADAARLLGEA